ncbi:prepilin-type N-terminal cleavage/methylation domain-containing protein [Pirellulales bacterium]|nr:prepilin-type N-terminal cleavage/methylation domain-containing protein [Pirellulales bacterium]
MCRNARGLTLLELLLVLVLLAVLGSLATPAIFNGFATVRLRRGGDQVLASWSAARMRAIELGEIQIFRFERETGNYRVGAPATTTSANADESGFENELDENGAIRSRQAAGRDESPSLPSDDAKEYLRLRTLPDKLEFTVIEFAEAAESSQLGSAAQEWSAPILFFPDGTTTDASVVVGNDREQFVRLTLRGLTGIGRGSNVLSHEELDRSSLSR